MSAARKVVSFFSKVFILKDAKASMARKFGNGGMSVMGVVREVYCQMQNNEENNKK